MQKKLLPSLAAAVIGAGLLVGASFAAPPAATPLPRPAAVRPSEAGRCASTSPPPISSIVDPALAYDAYGWGVLYMTNLMLLNYPDKPAPEGSRLVPDAAVGLPACLARRQDVHVHAQERTPVQRRLGRDRGGVQARLRTRGGSEAGLAGDRLHARRRRRRRPQRGQGAIGRRRQRERPDADDPPRPRRTRRSSPRSRCRSSPRSSRAWRSTRKGLNVYPSAGPYKIVSRAVGSQLVLERNTLLQGQPPCERGPDRDHDEHRREPEPAPGSRRPGRLRPVRPAADRARRPVEPVRRPRRAATAATSSTPASTRTYFALNTSRPALAKAEPAQGGQLCDRPAGDAPRGGQVRRQADAIRSCRRTCRASGTRTLYPIKGADPAKGRELASRCQGRDHRPAHDQPDLGRPGADHQVQPRADRPRA